MSSRIFFVKIQVLGFSINRDFYSIDRSDEENNIGVSAWFDWCSIPILSIQKSFQSMLDSSWSIKTRENWNILTLHTYLLKGCNPMGIVSLKKYKKSYEYSPRLLFIEFNNLLVSKRQVCRNILATCVWRQILS